MDWNNFTPIAAALGGALIGAASLMLLLFNVLSASLLHLWMAKLPATVANSDPLASCGARG